MITSKNIFISATCLFVAFCLIPIFLPWLFKHEIGIWFVTFHAIIVFFGALVLVGAGVYVFLNSKFIGTNRNIFLAFVLIVSGIFNIFHALSYGGMPQTIIFPSLSTSYYFWLGARIIIAGGLLLWVKIKSQIKNKYFLLLSFIAASFVVYLTYSSVDYFNQSLPSLINIFGSDLLKVTTEIFIIIAFLYIGIFELRGEKDNKNFFYYFLTFLTLAVLNEIYNILTPTNFDLYSIFSHIFEFLSYVFLYISLYQYFKNSFISLNNPE